MSLLLLPAGQVGCHFPRSSRPMVAHPAELWLHQVTISSGLCQNTGADQAPRPMRDVVEHWRHTSPVPQPLWLLAKARQQHRFGPGSTRQRQAVEEPCQHQKTQFESARWFRMKQNACGNKNRALPCAEGSAMRSGSTRTHVPLMGREEDVHGVLHGVIVVSCILLAWSLLLTSALLCIRLIGHLSVPIALQEGSLCALFCRTGLLGPLAVGRDARSRRHRVTHEILPLPSIHPMKLLERRRWSHLAPSFGFGDLRRCSWIQRPSEVEMPSRDVRMDTQRRPPSRRTSGSTSANSTGQGVRTHCVR